MSASGKPTYGHLEVTVIEARDLRNKELLFGKNDPYVELQLGNVKVETKVHQDGGSAGVWNETHVLEFPEGIVALDVNVYDEDRLKLDDLIGRTEILLHETVEKGMTEGWFNLQNRRANKAAGRIHLKLRFIPQPGRFVRLPTFTAYPTGHTASTHGPLPYPSGA